MAISKIVQNSLDTDSISLGPKIRSVQIANSTYVVKDDTAVNTGGGYIVITGSGFTSNSTVLIGSNTACSVTYVSTTQLRAQVPSATPGSYPVYVVTGDGGTAIRVNALTYSDSPTWVTTSPLTAQTVDTAFSIQLSATGANTYVLQTGSTLPSGVSLAANGLLSGTVTGINDDTTYNFTVEAVDAEAQESPKALAVTINGSDPYFNLTTMYLNGDGTNGANNSVIVDSSNNNYTITKSSDTTQGTFSPFSPAGFGAYFDGSDDSYSIPESADFRFGTGDFTIEAWLWIETTSNSQLAFHHNGSGGSFIVTGSTNVLPNRWNHCAVTRTGTTVRFWINGVQDTGGAQTIGATIYNNSDPLYIGRGADHSGAGASGRDICHCGEVGGSANKWFWYLASGGTGFFKGYISNFRLSNSVRYTTTFTPSTVDLTNDANTKLLTLNSNRPLDLSSSARVVTPIAGVKTTNFSPFKFTAIYSAETHGGSLYFDGDSDVVYATEASSQFTYGTGDFEYECWFYNDRDSSFTSQETLFGRNSTSNDLSPYIYIVPTSRVISLYYQSQVLVGSTVIKPYQWYHLVVSRVSGTSKIFLNGVQDATASDSNNLTAAGKLVVGGQWTGNTNMFKGYMSGIRVRKGSGSTSVTIPTTPPTAITNTNLLLNGTNAGIIDSSTRNVLETVGNAQVSTSVKKYGTGSLAFDGIGDYLLAPNNPAYLFNTGDFTVELYYYPTALVGSPANSQALIGMWGAGTSQASWLLYYSNGNLYWYTSTNGSTQVASITASSSLSINNWYHIAFVRNSGTTTIYVNGTSIGSTATVVNLFNANCSLVIGYNPIGGTPDYLYGYIDDLRITKGYARYTTTFTPPTGTFPRR